VILLGTALLIGAIIFAAITPGTDGVLVSTALLLNGVGWNFAFVAAAPCSPTPWSPRSAPRCRGWLIWLRA